MVGGVGHLTVDDLSINWNRCVFIYMKQVLLSVDLFGGVGVYLRTTTTKKKRLVLVRQVLVSVYPLVQTYPLSIMDVDMKTWDEWSVVGKSLRSCAPPSTHHPHRGGYSATACKLKMMSSFFILQHNLYKLVSTYYCSSAHSLWALARK